jgi:hypothetical protein
LDAGRVQELVKKVGVYIQRPHLEWMLIDARIGDRIPKVDIPRAIGLDLLDRRRNNGGRRKWGQHLLRLYAASEGRQTKQDHGNPPVVDPSFANQGNSF